MRILSDFLEWLSAVLRQWGVLVTGGFITAVLFAVQTWREQPFSWTLYKWVFVAFLIVALFLAWREQRQKWLDAATNVSRLQTLLDMSAPYFDVHQCGMWPLLVDDKAPKELKVANQYRFAVGASFKIHDSRRPASRITGRFVISKGSLLDPPDIDGPLDYGYSEMRLLNTTVQTPIPQDYPVAFVAVALDYFDAPTGRKLSQRWYWKWPGTTPEGLFLTEFHVLSTADTDRFVSYLKGIHPDWTL